MPSFRRAHAPGGTFFVTLVTENRARILCDDSSRKLLHNAIVDSASRRPFTLDAIVLLPDHFHMLMTLPHNDANFSTRLSGIKSYFTHQFLASGGDEQSRDISRIRKRRRGVWQRWFWEHRIRDEDDLNRHLDYIHYNPVKHGLASCPHAWPHSTFARFVDNDFYARDWQCWCNGQSCPQLKFDGLDLARME
ncbi:MAG TPA: transposase [Tepidisphaeraceae bacterium]|jgi:putative transposase|nr:transposase [Tepidisphaeraceae bacterium]